MSTKAPPSTLHQLMRVIRRESLWFPAILAKNATRYAAHKYLLHRPTLTRRIHGFTMQFNLTDPGISRSLLLVGDREREHRYILERVVKPGQTILDLGANIGYYVLIEHRLLKNTGHIIAIEPEPKNFHQLQINLELNDIPFTKSSNEGVPEQLPPDKGGPTRGVSFNPATIPPQTSITPLQAAVGDQDGTAQLHLSHLSNVHSLIKKQVSATSGQSITVPAISPATLNKKHGPIDLIRMDIEGYEQAILQSLVTLNTKSSSADKPEPPPPDKGGPTRGVSFNPAPATTKQQSFLPSILFELHPPTYHNQKFPQLLADLYHLGYHADYLACSHQDLLQKYNLEIETSIPTDGTIRHIARNVPLKALQHLAFHSRAVYLKAPSA